jgi:hypothetical protein
LFNWFWCWMWWSARHFWKCSKCTFANSAILL